jgi:peptidoglycan hydrolase CwlO-like protein
MSIETIVAIAVPLIALVFTALTFKRNSDKDTGETAAERATMTADIRYIRSSIDDIKLDNKSIQKDVGDLKTKVVEIEASVKSAHKRLDDLKKG